MGASVLPLSILLLLIAPGIITLLVDTWGLLFIFLDKILRYHLSDLLGDGWDEFVLQIVFVTKLSGHPKRICVGIDEEWEFIVPSVYDQLDWRHFIRVVFNMNHVVNFNYYRIVLNINNE